MDKNTLSHITWECKYHIVFAPKFRRQIIYGAIKADVANILSTLCKRKGVEKIEAECCKDHIHMLVRIPPSISVSDFMGYLKGKSSLMFNDEAPGFPFFLPKGMTIKNALIEYWRDIHTRENYVEVSTPMIMNRHLWETSGHLAHYKDNMYSTQIDDETYCVKPMNCPGGVMVYGSQPHSYRELHFV